jgi:predicted extracellular nuclease
MLAMKIVPVAIAWCILWTGTGTLCAQSARDHMLMFYNVENLFHPSHDSLKADEEFTPEGVRHWTWSRYRSKIARIAKVIHAAGGWDPPVLVGLCEVENENVLKDLVFHPVLVNYGYRIIHSDGPDPRGIDVALLYRQELISVLDTMFIKVDLPSTNRCTRDVLRVMLLSGTDSCVVYITHWPSKYSGAAETEGYRMHLAELLKHHMDSTAAICPGMPQLITGDLNDPSDAPSVRHLASGETVREVVPKGSSYKYKGKWQSIDHFLIADPEGRMDCSAAVFSPGWLLTDDELYTGKKPFRTYTGYRYSAGFSDHLPLLVRFQWRGE